MQVISYDQVRSQFDIAKALPFLEDAFVYYSEGRVQSPPVAHAHIADGSLHLKAAMLDNADFFTLKIAAGFPQNKNRGLPTGDGCILVFDRDTGALRSILCDRGHLTDVRTAIAGAIACRYLAPAVVARVGILGSGVQARLQARLQAEMTACRHLVVWSRSQAHAEDFADELRGEGFQVELCAQANDVVASCDLVITTTYARSPLLTAAALPRCEQLIVAVGADEPGKQELDPAILEQADLVVVDSYDQCRAIGELQHVRTQPPAVVELGTLIKSLRPSQTLSPRPQLVVCDLTGLAVQDLQMARLFVSPAPDA